METVDEFLNLKFMSHTTFYHIQRSFSLVTGLPVGPIIAVNGLNDALWCIHIRYVDWLKKPRDGAAVLFS